MARRRKLARYKKTGILIAGIGVATGVAAVLLWPQIKKLFQTPVIKVLPPTIKPATDDYTDFVNQIQQQFG